MLSSKGNPSGNIAMENEKLQAEIDRNLDIFLRKLPDLLKDQRNRYALMKNGEIVGLYDTIRDAQTTGEKLYEDKIFSIQQVTDSSVNLGFYSYAGGLEHAQ